MVVVVPVDGDVEEAEDVAHEHGPERDQVLKARAVRRLHLKHHDGDDDGENAVGKRSQPVAIHLRPGAITVEAPSIARVLRRGYVLSFGAALHAPPSKSAIDPGSVK